MEYEIKPNYGIWISYNRIHSHVIILQVQASMWSCTMLMHTWNKTCAGSADVEEGTTASAIVEGTTESYDIENDNFTSPVHSGLYLSCPSSTTSPLPYQSPGNITMEHSRMQSW